ncbi:MAG: hypothetical protein M1837_001866, partial [Sclerophora amabilis]
MRFIASHSLLFCLVTPLLSTASGTSPREECAINYQPCNPSGVRTTTSPQTGDALSSLFVNILDSIQGIRFDKRQTDEVLDVLEGRDALLPVCCAESTQCLLVHDLDVPFCYDKFTTNFFLPDGSYGTVVTGDYTAADGSHANLLSGDFSLSNGSTGNVYARDKNKKPNTATLTLPTPWTSTGVGVAIDPSTLGGFQTYVMVVPGTTRRPSTIPKHTVSAKPISGSSPLLSTVPATLVS